MPIGMRRLTVVVLGAVAVLSGTGSAAAPSSAAAAGNVLYAGQRLVARSSHASLWSPSGEFALEVSPDFVELNDYARLDGPKGPDFAVDGLWFGDDGTGRQSDTDRTTFTLRRTGNLVLATSRGVVLWSSHTSGSGSDNRLVLRDSGNLVMTTASGKVVWATHTTRVLLTPGQELASGRRLMSRWAERQGRGPNWSLAMRRDGNLVLSCGGRVFWQSRTHVPGSRLVLQEDGNLVIRGPHGRAQWSTHTAGAGPYTYLIGDAMQLDSLHRRKPLWDPHLPYRPTAKVCA